MEINLPSGLTNIGWRTFAFCESLTEIDLPSNITNIGYEAFLDCVSLTRIEIPASVTSIIGNVFLDCSNLTNIKVEEGNAVYDSKNNCNAVIETESNTLLIGSISTVIPSGVISIGKYAFGGYNGLKRIEIPSSVTDIGEYAFYGCDGLTGINIPSSVTDIGEYAFYGCDGLTGINIPSGLTSIGEFAFCGCGSLISIKVEEGNAVYDSRDDCNALIETESNTLLVGSINTVIPSSVAEIETSAFRDCSGLTSIEIPSGVTKIGNGAFEGCSGLVSIKVEKGNAVYDSRDDCNALIETERNTLLVGSISTVIPFSVTKIGYQAFYSCDRLTSIEIPSSVTEIGGDAFSGCSSLTSIEIPSSVTEIGWNAFLDCKNLASITVLNSELVLWDSGLGFYDDEIIPNFTIHGISGSVAEKYANNIGFTFLPIPDDTPPSKADLSKATVTLEKTSYTYDGKAKTPFVTVRDGKKTLSPGVDYSVTYQNNTNAGTAKARVTGRGNYTGTLTREFTIQKATPALSCPQTYNKVYGNKPFAIKVSRKSVTGSLSYTTSDKKVADVKNGKVTIKGTGVAVITIKAAANANYNARSIKSTIKVSPQKQAIKSLKPIKNRKLTVSWKKDAKAIGYQIQYSTDKKFKKGVHVVTVGKNKTVSKTIPKLAKGKRYYVRVCSYKTVKLNGKTQKLAGSWSTVKRSANIK